MESKAGSKFLFYRASLSEPRFTAVAMPEQSCTTLSVVGLSCFASLGNDGKRLKLTAAGIKRPLRQINRLIDQGEAL
jgi:hypothetical protein